MDLKKVCHAVLRVRQGKNIHQHLDLIAGLPFEDYQTFQRSFDTVYGWKPDQLQLGFLKVLKGSYMYGHADDYGIVCRSRAPYEVMATRWISYGELLEIHLVEQMLEQMYNSGQFRTAMSVLEKAYGSPFQMFLDMAHFFRRRVGWRAVTAGYSGQRCSWNSRQQKTQAGKSGIRKRWCLTFTGLKSRKAGRFGRPVCGNTGNRRRGTCGGGDGKKLLPSGTILVSADRNRWETGVCRNPRDRKGDPENRRRTAVGYGPCLDSV